MGRQHHDPSETTPAQWRERLDALLRARMDQPFAWGVHDCCLFAADAVLATTGRDLAAPWRGTYSDAAAAYRLVRYLGGLPAIADMAGPRVPPLAAQVGDVGLVVDISLTGERELLAVCAGANWLCPTARGLGAMPLSAARLAWRVAPPVGGTP